MNFEPPWSLYRKETDKYLISTIKVPYCDYYETMVLSTGGEDVFQKRCKTPEEAKQLHEEAIEFVKNLSLHKMEVEKLRKDLLHLVDSKFPE